MLYHWWLLFLLQLAWNHSVVLTSMTKLAIICDIHLLKVAPITFSFYYIYGLHCMLVSIVCELVTYGIVSNSFLLVWGYMTLLTNDHYIQLLPHGCCHISSVGLSYFASPNYIIAWIWISVMLLQPEHVTLTWPNFRVISLEQQTMIACKVGIIRLWHHYCIQEGNGPIWFGTLCCHPPTSSLQQRMLNQMGPFLSWIQ